jgi:hypothetical protein
MRLLLLICTLFLLTSCGNKKLTASSPEKFDMEVLADVIAQQDLENIYPEAQIANGREFFEEGTVERSYSILYPHSTDKILVIWKDPERTELHQIYLDGKSRWRSKTGIHIGTTYDELVELNGGPLKFYGFGWDYSGAVDWNKGGLANSNIRVFLEPTVAPPRDFYTDKVIETTDDEIDNLKLRVRAIILNQPEVTGNN